MGVAIFLPPRGASGATDPTPEILLTKSYDPYGETIASSGNYVTPYGFTGEMTGDTGLVNLRARWYDSSTGRFLTKDSWNGDYQDPLSLLAWSYVEDDPINFIDTNGYWRWQFTSSIAHFMVEQYYEGSPTNPNKQLEYRIPETPLRHPDMFNSLTGDIYEIEPWYLRSDALPQAMGYESDLQLASTLGALTGSYLGQHYNWNSTPFHVGNGEDWPGKFRFPYPNFPAVDLVADYTGPGTIVYWIEPNVLAIEGAIPFLVPNKRLVRPKDWIPGQRASQPVTAFSISEACGYGLITVGGTVIAVTVTEDITTLGLGTFDDVITVPAGLYFINLGQRLATYVPVN